MIDFVTSNVAPGAVEEEIPTELMCSNPRGKLSLVDGNNVADENFHPDNSTARFINQTIAGKYFILGKVKQHGRLTDTNGVVYRAIDLPLSRLVAVRIFRLCFDQRNNSFESAYSIASKRETSIPIVYECGKLEDGWRYVATEFVHAEKLSDFIRQISAQEFIRLWTGICDAIELVHKRGLVVTSIGPHKIAVNPIDMTCSILGLETAMPMKSRTSRAALVASSATIRRYASPELLQLEQIDHRSDVYSLGCLLRKMVLECVIDIDTGIDLDPIPAFVAHILNCALETNPADRYQTVAELKTAVVEGFKANSRKPSAIAKVKLVNSERGKERGIQKRPLQLVLFFLSLVSMLNIIYLLVSLLRMVS